MGLHPLGISIQRDAIDTCGPFVLPETPPCPVQLLQEQYIFPPLPSSPRGFAVAVS